VKLTNTEIENEWSYTSTSTVGLYGLQRDSLCYFIVYPAVGGWPDGAVLTLRLLMSYIYGAASKARNANVVYIWTYVWQR